MLGNRELYGQGQQRTEKDGGLWRRATSCSGRTQPRIEENRKSGVVLTPRNKPQKKGEQQVVWR